MCVRGDGGRGAGGIEAGGVGCGVAGGSRTLMEEDLGGVGGGVGCGNRTLIETFACKRVDLIRARMQSILAARMQESTALIFDRLAAGLVRIADVGRVIAAGGGVVACVIGEAGGC